MINNDNALEIFISYSHKDEEYKNQLENHLSMLRRTNVISTWNDRKITAGSEWKGEIDEHLNTAHIILLLISSNFLASDYCYDIEMKRAMERYGKGEAIVIPIIVRDVDGWHNSPFGKLQALPKDAKPISQWENEDEALTNVVRGIRELIAGFRFVPSKKKTNIIAKHRRNPNFKGRENQLSDLNSLLSSGNYAALTQSITGLGGIGKTQIAIEYVYRNLENYNLIWWIEADSVSLITSSYNNLANVIGISTKSVDQEIIIYNIKEWLSKNDSWLLVFDNANNPLDIVDFLPNSHTGHIIITSRNYNWSEVAQEIPLKVFEPSEAVSFLLDRTNQKDMEAATNICGELEYLPLALEQAAAYINAHKKTLASYLELYRKHRIMMFEKVESPINYHSTVATTWDISFSAIQNVLPNANEFIALCAFLDPHDIPLAMFKIGKRYLTKNLEIMISDELKSDEIIKTLLEYSLIEITDETLSIHRLVQAVIRDRMSNEEKREQIKILLKVVYYAYYYIRRNNKASYLLHLIYPHALSIIKASEDINILNLRFVILLRAIGDYQNECGYYNDVKNTYEKLLIKVGNLNVNHRGKGYKKQKAIILIELGIAYFNLGALEDSRKSIEEGINRLEQYSITTDIEYIYVYSILGEVYCRLGNLEKALSCHKKVLENYDKAKHDNKERGHVYNNYGSTLVELGKFNEAKEAYEKAIELYKSEENGKNKETAIAYSNYALLLRSLGDYTNAKEKAEIALGIAREVFPSIHPSISRDLNNIGLIKISLGEYDDALLCLEEALEISKKVIGDIHPDIATTYNNIGMALEGQLRCEEALEYFYKAYELSKNYFSDNPSDVAKYSNNYGNVLGHVGEYESALKYLAEALEIDKAVFGDIHPEIAIDLSNISEVLIFLNRSDEALINLKKALYINNKYFREDHPNVLHNYKAFGMVYLSIGNIEKSKLYYEKAIKVAKNIFKVGNFDVLKLIIDIGLAYYKANEKSLASYFLKITVDFSDCLQDDCSIGQIELVVIMINQLTDLQNYQEAQFWCMRIINLIETKWQDEISEQYDFSYLGVLNIIGFITYKQKNYYAALEYSKKALKQAKKIYHQDDPIIKEIAKNINTTLAKL